VGLDIAAETVVARERQLLVNSLVMYVILLPAAVVWALLMSRSLTRPLASLTARAGQAARVDLKSLTEAAQAIARGDLTQAVTLRSTLVPLESSDEIDQLGRVFNLMIEQLQAVGRAFDEMMSNLRQMIGRTAVEAGAVQAASDQLAVIAEQAGQATSQIAATMQQIAIRSAQQTDGVTRTAGSMEQMRRAIEGVAQGAQEQAGPLPSRCNPQWRGRGW